MDDIEIQCSDCGKMFVFTVGEQKFYKQNGYQNPKRCKTCRQQRKQIQQERVNLNKFNGNSR
jgi:hypothetical protein